MSAILNGQTIRRRFDLHPSPVYEQAVQACRVLLQQEGFDAARRACAEAIWEAIRAEYVRASHLKPSHSAHVCVHRLMGDRCPDDISHLQIPGADHLSEWKKDRRTVSLVSQPYRLAFETLKKMVDFCDAHGLRADVRAEGSWHFPGSTVLIAYRRREKQEASRQRE